MSSPVLIKDSALRLVDRAAPSKFHRAHRPATIGGRPFSGHSIDRMQGRGLPPSAVHAAIRPENLVGTNNGLHIYWARANAVQVIVNPQTNVVVSANWRRVPPRLRRPE